MISVDSSSAESSHSVDSVSTDRLAELASILDILIREIDGSFGEQNDLIKDDEWHPAEEQRHTLEAELDEDLLHSCCEVEVIGNSASVEEEGSTFGHVEGSPFAYDSSGKSKSDVAKTSSFLVDKPGHLLKLEC